MDARKELLLMSATGVYSLGLEVEAERENKTVGGAGDFLSSRKMLDAYEKFPALDGQWREMERQHLKQRDDIRREWVKKTEETM